MAATGQVRPCRRRHRARARRHGGRRYVEACGSPQQRRPPQNRSAQASAAAAAAVGEIRACRRSHGGHRCVATCAQPRQRRPPRDKCAHAAAAAAPASAGTATITAERLAGAQGCGGGRPIGALRWAAVSAARPRQRLQLGAGVRCGVARRAIGVLGRAVGSPAAAVAGPAPGRKARVPEAGAAAARLVRPGARSIGLRPPLPRPSLVQPPRVGLAPVPCGGGIGGRGRAVGSPPLPCSQKGG